MDLYEEVETLFKISEEAFNRFYTLKHTMQKDGEDILCVYKNRNALNKDISEIKKIYSYLHIDKIRNIIKLSDERKIYLKTIEECKTLDGYRFKEVKLK